MYPEINYTIYKTKRKNLLLKLKNDGSFAIYCPKGYSKIKALDFLYFNYDKMKILADKKNKKKFLTLFTNLSAPSLMYLGKNYPVSFGTSENLTFDGIYFYAPQNISFEKLHLLYKNFLRAEAKRILPQLVKTIAEKNDFSYGKIYVKNIYSRFGSCSSKKNLNFSLSLPAFDYDFIKFIVCHELVHTVYLNHGKQFHDLLNLICPYSRSIELNFKNKYSELVRCICP